MARPKANIDADQVEKLAAIQCTLPEMAAVLNCNVSTLQRRFAQHIEKGREHGRMSLKRKQYEVAMNGNVGMLIWLGKQHLTQSDKVELGRLPDMVLMEEIQKRLRLNGTTNPKSLPGVSVSQPVEPSTDKAESQTIELLI